MHGVGPSSQFPHRHTAVGRTETYWEAVGETHMSTDLFRGPTIPINPNPAFLLLADPIIPAAAGIGTCRSVDSNTETIHGASRGSIRKWRLPNPTRRLA